MVIDNRMCCTQYTTRSRVSCTTVPHWLRQTADSIPMIPTLIIHARSSGSITSVAPDAPTTEDETNEATFMLSVPPAPVKMPVKDRPRQFSQQPVLQLPLYLGVRALRQSPGRGGIQATPVRIVLGTHRKRHFARTSLMIPAYMTVA